MISKENAEKIDSKMNLNAWITLQKVEKCFLCSYKSPLYKNMGKGAKLLNPDFVIHFFQTHGIPPIELIAMLAEVIYPQIEDRQKMQEFYKFLEKY